MRADRLGTPVQQRESGLPSSPGTGGEVPVQKRQGMRRGETGDRRREPQIAGGHRSPPPGTPLRQHPGPLRIPVRTVQFQAARTAGAPGQDERPDHPCGLDHSRIEMRSARRDPGAYRVRDGCVHREAVPGSDDDQGEAGLSGAPRQVTPGSVRPRPPGAGPGADRRTSRRAATSRRSPTDAGASPAGATSQGSTRPPSSTSTCPTPAPDSTDAMDAPTRPAPRTWTRIARRAAIRRVLPPGSGRTTDRDATSGRWRSIISARRHRTSAPGPADLGSSRSPASANRFSRVST